jgi:hypothetical protein
LQISNPRYRGFCLKCFIHKYPFEKVSRDYKSKEASVVERVIHTFANLSWAIDTRVSGGQSLRRPDLLVDLGDRVIVVEIDENQHESYDLTCENKRNMELSMDVGHRPMVMIRFNPDGYIHKDSRKVTSCWSVGKDGLVRLKKNKKIEWHERLDTLTENIAYYINPTTKMDKMFHCVTLFYDMYSTK